MSRPRISNKDNNEITNQVLRDVAKCFRFDSVDYVENDDDVFVSDPTVSTSTATTQVEIYTDIEPRNQEKVESFFHSDGSVKTTLEVKAEMQKRTECRPRRISDVIDCLGENGVNLRRGSDNGEQLVSPGSRASSDLGYASNFATSPSSSFTYQSSYMSKRINHSMDSTPNNKQKGQNNETYVPVAIMPCERDAEEYNMNHRHRGVAVIISNDTFENNLASYRRGSDVDVKNLHQCFQKLGFEVRIYANLSHLEITTMITELSEEDHSDSDCLLVSVLTHGMEGGLLYARDALYPVDILWKPFTAKSCSTLAGKPKLFFVQACRGEKLDNGVTLVTQQTETDSGNHGYKIPNLADFLIAYSSTDGYYSWRNPDEGTWFIQSVAEEFNRHGNDADILKILTRINRRVALNFSSYNDENIWLHNQKQIPTFYSTLIRDLIFRPK